MWTALNEGRRLAQLIAFLAEQVPFRARPVCRAASASGGSDERLEVVSQVCVALGHHPVPHLGFDGELDDREVAAGVARRAGE